MKIRVVSIDNQPSILSENNFSKIRNCYEDKIYFNSTSIIIFLLFRKKKL